MYIAIFNASGEDGEMNIKLSELEINVPVTATELWSGQTGEFTENINVSIAAHGAMAFYLS
jgi:hypothetical protein